MLQKLPVHTISFKIPLFFVVVALVPLLLSNIFWYYSIRPVIISDIASTQEQAASAIAEQVKHTVTDIVQNITVTTHIPSFTNGNIAEEKDILSSLMHNDSNIMQIALLNKNGLQLANFTKEGQNPSLTDKKNSSEFINASEGNMYISPVMFSSDQPTVSIAVPIQSTTGAFEGAVTARITLQAIQQIISTFHVGKEGYIYIVDQTGVVIAHPKTDGMQYIGQNLSTLPQVATILSHPIDSNIDSISNEYINENGINAFTSYAYISPMKWYVIAEDPSQEALNQINTISLIGILLILLGLLWIALGSLILSKTITRPLLTLTSGVKRITRGDFDHVLTVPGNDEISVLAHAFNTMRRHLKTYIAQTMHDKEKFASVINNVIDGVIVLDKDFKVLLFSHAAEQILGLSQEDLIGEYIDNAFTFRINNKVQIQTINFKDFVLANNTIDNTLIKLDTLFISPRQKTSTSSTPEHMKTVSLNGIIMNKSNNENIYLIATIHDISAQAELEEMKVDFVSMAAHELRTPITAIRGYISLLDPSKNPNLTEDQAMYVSRTAISANQLLTLVENLLNVSKIEKGNININLTKVDFNHIIDNVLITENDIAKQKNISIVFHRQENLPPVDADAFRISEVLTNLISNAINYTNPSGTITITTEFDDKLVTVHVSDTGEGIPKEAISHLFTKFFRVGGKLEQGSKGTGLGLFISKAIVEMHKGTIWVESELGKGSTFSFTLHRYSDG